MRATRRSRGREHRRRASTWRSSTGCASSGSWRPPPTRFTEGDVRRARILHSLDAGGHAARGDRRGRPARASSSLGFVDDPAYGLFAGLTDETFGRLSERTGDPARGPRRRCARRWVAAARRRTIGCEASSWRSSRPSSSRSDTASGRRSSSDRCAPMGDSLRRMAEVEADWWMTDVIAAALRGRGASMADVGPRTAAFSNALQPARASAQILAAVPRPAVDTPG